MKLQRAVFTILSREHGLVFVQFTYDEAGKPLTASVFRDGEDKPVSTEDNAKSVWRACITHALQLIDRAFYKPPKDTHAKQREKATKPALRLYEGGHVEPIARDE
jgi:hypothetical protein